MRKLKVYTNKAFERFIDYICRGRKFEGRWDDLDIDDMAADIEVPTDSEIDSAVRNLDILDDVAVKTGAQDIEVGNDGKFRLLDLDEPSNNSKDSDIKPDARTAGLDLDVDTGRHSSGDNQQTQDADSDEVRTLDFDEPVDVKDKKSNIGNVIGKLDYDDDIDTSELVASIDDVYTALASSDPKIVKSMIKRYAPDITDTNKIREILLAHAVQLNYESLRVMCGEMKITLTAKEKSLEYIDRDDINDALARFRRIASTLTGENNTYGLIPNAIVSCTPDNQIKCVNIIDFLVVWANLPLSPLYFRGAIARKCYDVADYLLDEDKTLPQLFSSSKFDSLFLTGKKGLLTKLRNATDVPNSIFSKLANMLSPKLKSNVIGEFIIAGINNNCSAKTVKDLMSKLSEVKVDLVTEYIDDNGGEAYSKFAKIMNIKD